MESLLYFTNKRGTYGIIADDLRFTTQLSNVYGNAIRHARCQKLFLFSLSVAKQKEKRREDLERITSGYGTQLRMNRSIQTEGSDKCAFSAVQVLYQIYKLNLSFYSKKTSTSKVGDELRLLLT